MATDNTESSMVSVDNIVSLRAADVEGLTNISTLSEEVAVSLCPLSLCVWCVCVCVCVHVRACVCVCVCVWLIQLTI